MRPLEEKQHLETMDSQFLCKTQHVNATNLPIHAIAIDFTEN